ncbi:hypothetical protein Tco_1248247 [Tanacetum coccineum]
MAEALATAEVTGAANTQEETNRGTTATNTRTCSYKEFRACFQGNLCGTKGVVGLTRWFKKLESQFGVSNVAKRDRVKFAASTLSDSALTWWNIYTKLVGIDAAHAISWSNFKQMMINKIVEPLLALLIKEAREVKEGKEAKLPILDAIRKSTTRISVLLLEIVVMKTRFEATKTNLMGIRTKETEMEGIRGKETRMEET